MAQELARKMSTLQKLWRATRDDLLEFGQASRPPKPGDVQPPAAEEIQRLQRERLDKNGPKDMSAEGFARAEQLLKLAQSRPGGWAMRNRKKVKEEARARGLVVAPRK